MLTLQKVLVPVDFSSASGLALRYAKELATCFDSALYVLHVADDPILFAPTTSDEYRARFEDDSNSKLQQLVQDSVGNFEKVHVETKCGSAATEIIDYAQVQEINLIVMGSHGRSAMASMLLGAVAEHVVRHASCPVLTVRSPEHEFDD